MADLQVVRYDAAAEAAAEATAEPEATVDAEATAAAEETADTEATAEPEVTAEPEATEEPAAETGTSLRVLVSIDSQTTQVRNMIETEMRAKYPDFVFVTIDHVSAVAGKDLISNAVKALLIAFACMLVYIAIRFDFYSGVVALGALVHDVLIMCSFMVFFRGVFQANSPFIAAVLTIVGYSINNTIIIFDRIRENAKKPGQTKWRRSTSWKYLSFRYPEPHGEHHHHHHDYPGVPVHLRRGFHPGIRLPADRGYGWAFIPPCCSAVRSGLPGWIRSTPGRPPAKAPRRPKVS